jgi:hypothetical protein
LILGSIEPANMIIAHQICTSLPYLTSLIIVCQDCTYIHPPIQIGVVLVYDEGQ